MLDRCLQLVHPRAVAIDLLLLIVGDVSLLVRRTVDECRSDLTHGRAERPVVCVVPFSFDRTRIYADTYGDGQQLWPPPRPSPGTLGDVGGDQDPHHWRGDRARTVSAPSTKWCWTNRHIVRRAAKTARNRDHSATIASEARQPAQARDR